jgi:hypothetical protein
MEMLLSFSCPLVHAIRPSSVIIGAANVKELGSDIDSADVVLSDEIQS